MVRASPRTSPQQKMDMNKMEEFRSNLLLLLQCGYPEGLAMNQLKAEYKQHFAEDVAPESILPRGFKNNKHWDTLFQLKEFREDFSLFYLGTAVWVKAIRKRNFAEMKLIAQLAKHSHMMSVKRGEFHCSCCPHDHWGRVAKEAGQGPVPQVVEIISSTPEEIIVKIEPNNHHHHHQLANGDHHHDDSTSTSGVDDNSIYSAVQQQQQQGGQQQGNHQHNHNYVNGNEGGGGSSTNSNTNDGFMLDHQLRIQEQSSPQSGQGQNLQAFASLLNSASGPPAQPAEGGNQPFYTFVIQNGEIKVMQIVSSGADGQTPNGEALSAAPPILISPNTTLSSPVPPTARKSLPPKRPAPDRPPPELETEAFTCSMPGCGETFEIKQHLQNHERTCNMKKYPCPFPGCDRRFKNSKQRHAHMTSRHKGTENAFRCTVPECTAVFKTADRLKVHESRCRFKYEQFQLMEIDDAAAAALQLQNNNNTVPATSYSSSINSTVSTEPQSSAPNAAFASIQAASIISVPISNSVHTPIKLENGTNSTTVQIPNNNTTEFQGFSTVDLSLVKAEIAE